MKKNSKIFRKIFKNPNFLEWLFLNFFHFFHWLRKKNIGNWILECFVLKTSKFRKILEKFFKFFKIFLRCFVLKTCKFENFGNFTIWLFSGIKSRVSIDFYMCSLDLQSKIDLFLQNYQKFQNRFFLRCFVLKTCKFFQNLFFRCFVLKTCKFIKIWRSRPSLGRFFDVLF